MSTKKKRIARKLTSEEKSKIFHLVAAGYPVKEIASDFEVKYGTVRNIVFSQWQALYPKHFTKASMPKSIETLKKNPPKAA